MPIWKVALDLVQDVRGTLGMYLFIIEESIQTVGMACWTLYKANRISEVRELAQWIIDEIIEPAIVFNETYGKVAYPLNEAYGVFYESSRKNMETYLKLTERVLVSVVSSELASSEFKFSGTVHKTPWSKNWLYGQTFTLEVITKQVDDLVYKMMRVNGVDHVTDRYTFELHEDTEFVLIYGEP